MARAREACSKCYGHGTFISFVGEVYCTCAQGKKAEQIGCLDGVDEVIEYPRD
jgi:hypothetical protein